MKRVFYINYWLMLLGWCLFLNGYSFLAVLSTILATTILYTANRDINHWRFFAVFLLGYMLTLIIYFVSSIPNFFPNLYLIIGTNSLNMALMMENVTRLKAKSIIPVYIVIILIMISAVSITFFLPDTLYSVFSKANLYRMIGIIFMPSALSFTICLLNKELLQTGIEKEVKPTA